MEKTELRLKQYYKKEVIEKLLKELSLKNKLAVPKLEKVVVNVGAGDITKNKELAEIIVSNLGLITGQKPSARKARVSVASFSVRKGMTVGYKVTLRGDKMYVFVDKLFSIVLPRLRDFRGLPLSSLDQSGNLTIGFVDNLVFPEIDVNKTNKPFGMEITLVTNTKNRERARKLFELLGLPFMKEDRKNLKR